MIHSAGIVLNVRYEADGAIVYKIGLTEMEIADLPNVAEASLRRQQVRSPISGKILERKVELGVALGRDNLETELFVVADLNSVWVELAVSPEDVPMVQIGQSMWIAARGTAQKAVPVLA